MQRRLNIGEQLGEYRITQFLGAGGMGEVYRGEHAKLGRSAAIKVLLSTVTDESFTQRFFNEARLQANLHHPNIAALYDFQEIGGQLCIFMEYVDGVSLEDVVNARSLAVEDALGIFAFIVEAVGFIHSHGIVHRDIKSQNVKLTADGKPKLLDFGIAKDSSAAHGLTQTGGVIGTPHYLAPEQLDGKPATAQADIWALGVLLYEMLTGDMPFQGETLAGLVLQITTAQFAAPETLNPAVSRDVSRIVSRCLKKNLSERYHTTDELLTDVRKVLSGEKSSTISLGKTFGLFGKKEEKPYVPAFSPSPAPQNQYGSNDYNSNDYGSSDYSPSNYSSSSYSLSENSTPEKKLPLGLIAGVSAIAVVLLFSIVGIGVYLMSGGDSGNFVTNGKSTANGSTAVVVPNAPTRQIKIDVDEGKAQVFRGDESLGLTPLDLNVRDGEKVALTLKRDGFEDKNVQFETGGGKRVYTFSLKQK
jgi:serine/threonine-protein kinase